jgi:hypothetical protein
LLNGSTARRSRAGRGAAGARAAAATAEDATKAIAAAGERLDEPRVVGVVAERGPQAFHRGVEAVLEVHVGAVGPELAAQLLPGHHVARAPQEQAQDFERLFLQPDP